MRHERASTVADRFHHFFHLYADGDWGRPVAEHLNTLDRIGVPYRVTCGVVGSPKNRAEAIRCLPDSWEIIEFSDGFENRTLSLIQERLTDLPVLYAHTKGAGFPLEYSDPWRACLTRQVVGRWRTNLQALTSNDMVGAHWLIPEAWEDVDVPYFGGNYWWATADHLRKLGPVDTSDRFGSERWVGSVPATVLNLVSGWPGPECATHEPGLVNPLDVYAFEDGAACGYYRVRLPFEWLDRMGHTMTTTDMTQPEHPSMQGARIVMGQRIGGQDFDTIWYNLRQAGVKLVWETDDDLWSMDESNPARLQITDMTRYWMESALTHAHLVTTTVPHLADVMRKFNPNVTVIPNAVDPALLTTERKRADKLTIGWAGGSSHHDDFRSIIGPIREVTDLRGDLDFHSIGVDYGKDFGLNRNRFTPWKASMLDYYSGVDFDIGLAPLLDTEFTRSKSPIKAIEYNALGIPVIASNVGPYKDYIIDGVNGFLVNTETEWVDRMNLLLEDADMRARMGAAGRVHAEAHTINHTAPLWEAAFRSLETL
jgi:glycosyltransferase involved in cell wall biosynthesis